jgi:transcriptional regulator with XRE-family HTH domain
MQSPFGIRLRQFREAKGLTLQQVADAVECTKAYVWELEMRAGQKPTAERLNGIAKALGVTIQDLLGEPVAEMQTPTPIDVAFFREYAGMSEEEKERYRQAMKLMFGNSAGRDGDKS